MKIFAAWTTHEMEQADHQARDLHRALTHADGNEIEKTDCFDNFVETVVFVAAETGQLQFKMQKPWL